MIERERREKRKRDRGKGRDEMRETDGESRVGRTTMTRIGDGESRIFYAVSLPARVLVTGMKRVRGRKSATRW